MNKFYLRILVLVTLIIAGYFLINNQQSKKSKVSQIQQESTSSQIQVAVDCSGKVTPQLTEGPYYKLGSPERTDLREVGVVGEKLTLTGFVFDVNCQPIEGAWIDFWQANGEGIYDNSGYKLRGHQYTDNAGKYILETVIPGRYPGRTPHIHIKVRVSKNSPIITSQLFMPGESQNQTDTIFNKELVMDVRDTPAGKVAIFNFTILD